ncbi:MAG: Gx transporter family protein [Magnetococcales bacterium]|nr:Gx transporter family protein [Magnetococcales bacterium]
MSEASKGLRRDLLVAYLAAAALAAHLLEAVAPGPGPWFKPGLANVFALVAFFRFGWRAAVSVTLIRVVAGSMVLGTLFSPTFLLSFCGAVGAMAAMGLADMSPARLGPVGVSLLAALAHMLAQTVAAWLLVIGHAGILTALPWFLAGSWITGIMNGLLTFLLLERFDRHQRLLDGM